jgi:type II pantothenate kinase
MNYNNKIRLKEVYSLNVQKVGIDVGGSLIKIVYEEHGKIHYKTYPILHLDNAMKWIKMVGSNAVFALTGGKAAFLHKNYFTDAKLVPEFEATCDGARFFLSQEADVPSSYLLVNIGTGTSWFFVNEEKQKRILGSGIGGGTFMGLGHLLTGERDFSELVALAMRGNKEYVDLTVSDIYMGEDTPIDGSLTASNFAKGKRDNQRNEDLMAAVSNMVAETIVLLTLQAATIHQTKDVIYMGSTFTENEPLKKVLESYKEMMGLKTLFLKKGEYCGAMGALLNL